MPMIAIEELLKIEPRWPDNEYGIPAPAGICGDYRCACADKARKIMTPGEYQIAFGVPPEYGVRED